MRYGTGACRRWWWRLRSCWAHAGDDEPHDRPAGKQLGRAMSRVVKATTIIITSIIHQVTEAGLPTALRCLRHTPRSTASSRRISRS